MLKKIDLTCKNCLGFEVTGNVTGADYEDIMIPEIEKKLKDYSKIGFLYHIWDDFEKYEAKAIFDDTKVGFQHIRAFERIAVVTNLNWVSNGIHIFSVIFPGKIKIFKNDELEAAKEWISQTPILKQWLNASIDKNKWVMYFKPLGKITPEDFEYLWTIMDPYIEKNNDLNGLIIDSSEFTGYESFDSFITHFKFVKWHQKHIEKLAILTDSNLVLIIEKLASIFMHAEIKRFKLLDKDKAIEWMGE